MFKSIINAVRGSDETQSTDEQDERDGGTGDADAVDPGSAHAATVAPSSMFVRSDTVRASNRYVTTLFVADWPDTASPGMLDMVTTYPSSEVDVSIHASPREQSDAVDQFDAAIRDLQSQEIAENRTGSPSRSATEKRRLEHERIRAQLAEGAQSVFDVSVYITIRTVGRERTEKVARKIANELAKHQLHATSADYRQEDALASASPVAKDVLAGSLPNVTTPMLGRSLGALFPFSATTLIEETGVRYGRHATTESPVIVDRFARPNGYNVFTAGMIGAGKSYGTKLLTLRRLVRDPDTILVMLDPLDGFRELAEALDAETVTVDGSRGLNPLEIRETPGHVLDENPQLDPFRQAFSGALGFFESFFETVESGPDTLGKTERAVLSEAVRTAYARQGITSDPSTHGRDSPTVTDVLTVLAEIEDDPGAYLADMEDEGDLVGLPDAPDPGERQQEKWADAAGDLRVAMHPFRTAEYAHLAGESDVDLRDAKVTYLDLQQGEGDREMGVMMQLLLDAVYQRAKTSSKKVVLCVDEAHYLMQNEASLGWLERLTRHSRHHDLSLHLVTQEASDFLVNEQAETIANNCSIKMLHGLPGLSDEHADALGLSPREARFVREAQPGDPERGYSQALLDVQDDATLPLKVSADGPEKAVIEGASDDESAADGGRAARAGGDD